MKRAMEMSRSHISETSNRPVVSVGEEESLSIIFLGYYNRVLTKFLFAVTNVIIILMTTKKCTQKIFLKNTSVDSSIKCNNVLQRCKTYFFGESKIIMSF